MAKKQKEKITLTRDEPAALWLTDDEGELAVDVYEDSKNMYVVSTVAGAQPNDIQIAINNDLLTIRGARKPKTQPDDGRYYYRECFWGTFSRSIILPVEVKADKVAATLELGILTITLPKLLRQRNVPITIKTP